MSKVSRQELLGLLESLEPGISGKGIIEQSECFVFQKGTVYTFNGETACCAPSILNGVTGAVRADKLLEKLKLWADEELDVYTKGPKLFMRRRRGHDHFVMEQDVLLPFETVDLPGKWKPLHEDFCEAVGTVASCASNDERQSSNLCCVHIAPDWIEASDDFQVCRWPMKTGLKGSALVRHYSIKPIAEMGMTEFAETDSWLHFRNRSKLIYSCLKFVEDFPDLGNMFNVKGRPVKLPKGLVDCLSNAEIWSNENEAVGHQVRVTIEPGRAVVEGLGISGGSVDMTKARYAGPPVKFMISPAILKEVITKYPESVISKDRIMVSAGRFTYVSCLDISENGHEEEAEKPKSRRDEEE